MRWRPLDLLGLIVSVDSDRLAEHERNRSLQGLTEQMAKGIAPAGAFGIPVNAFVRVSRLVDCAKLPGTQRRVGFEAVGFSYLPASFAEDIADLQNQSKDEGPSGRQINAVGTLSSDPAPLRPFGHTFPGGSRCFPNARTLDAL